MALTYIFLTNPGAAAVAQPGAGGQAGSGVRYTANSAGIITGVTPADAFTLTGINGAPVQMIAATGLTADRPGASQSGLATSGAFNALNLQPTPGFPFYDQSLSTLAIFVGTGRSSTGYVDRTGAAV